VILDTQSLSSIGSSTAILSIVIILKLESRLGTGIVRVRVGGEAGRGIYSKLNTSLKREKEILSAFCCKHSEE
jgi:hypothetical protein